MSKYDNRDLWKRYDYRELGLIAEPYFDLDFSEVLYLTDTGRRWDGGKVSIRDSDQFDRQQFTVNSGSEVGEAVKQKKRLSSKYSFHSTEDIIEACQNDELPDKIMFNFHPQRWTDNNLLWIQELILQRVKNFIKRGLTKLRV